MPIKAVCVCVCVHAPVSRPQPAQKFKEAVRLPRCLIISKYLRVGKLPRGIAVGQLVALLNEDAEALAVCVVAHGEDDVPAHLHTVKVSRFTVNTHQAAQCAL